MTWDSLNSELPRETPQCAGRFSYSQSSPVNLFDFSDFSLNFFSFGVQTLISGIIRRRLNPSISSSSLISFFRLFTSSSSILGLMYFVGLRISESISGISSSRIGEEFRAIRLIKSAFFKRLYLFSPSRLALAFNSGSFFYFN